MNPILENSKQLTAIAQELRDAEHASANLIYSIAEKTSRRLQRRSANFAQLDRLIAAGAFTEAMLNLIEFELPLWKLRRVAYDEGEWHCALSRERELPEWLDQSAETHHVDLAIAIALAYVEICKAAEPSARSIGHSVPQVRPQSFEALACENFA